MKTIQQYFDANFKGDEKLIIIEKLSEELTGKSLTIKNFSNLEFLDVKELKGLEEVIIDNCPKLKSIKYANQEQNPVIIQPNNKCDWRCFAIAGLILWNAIIFYLIIRWLKNHKKDCKTCQSKNKL